MGSAQKKMNRLGFALGLPEVRIFWFLLPLLIAIFALTKVPDDFFPRGIVELAITALLLAVAAIVFTASYLLARKNWETKVERNELKSIMATINDALIVYDQDFRVLFFNPAAEHLFGISASGIVGSVVSPKLAELAEYRLLAQVIFPSLAPTLVHRSRPGTYPQVVDVSFDDPPLDLRITTANTQDERGAVAGFMKIIANRTQEVAIIRSKNEFVTVASHQLRTPITEVSWALDTVLGDPALSPDSKDLLIQTNISAKKILNIVEDLLNITKMEEGHFGYSFESRNIVEFLDSILGPAMPQVEHAGLKLYFDRPKDETPPVSIDTQKLGMVIANLVDNAVRYNVQNGRVTVRVRRADDPRFVEVSVKDTGIGVPPDEIKRLFTKFYRGSNAVKFQTDGSGLGLWIARSIIRAHGGEMWAESELQRGTTFSFTLPVDPLLMPTPETAAAATTT